MDFISTILRPFAHVPRMTGFEDTVARTIEPEHVIIPLEYPGQVLYKPLVTAGAKVKKNQIIGKSALGNCVHASVSGTVREIKPIWTARSFNVPAVIIDRNDEPAWTMDDLFEQYGVQYQSATRLQRLKAAGVVSPWTLPGRFHHEEDVSDFPDVEHIIIKGVNEEPSVFIFEILLQQQAEKVLKGLNRLGNLAPKAQKWLTVPRRLEVWAKKAFGDQLKVVVLSDEYKDRIERLVVPKITGIDVPNTEPYRKMGIAVISVEYLLSMVDALDGVGPFVTKHLTVSSGDGQAPVTVAFPVGTTIKSVLAGIGANGNSYGRIVVGGPMKGNAQYTDETPLTKSSHGIFLVPKEAIPEEVNLTCMNCGRCTRACPVRLQVHLIGRYVEHGLLAESKAFHPEACNACGLCTYVCPAHRPLVQLIKMSIQYDRIEL